MMYKLIVIFPGNSHCMYWGSVNVVLIDYGATTSIKMMNYIESNIKITTLHVKQLRDHLNFFFILAFTGSSFKTSHILSYQSAYIFWVFIVCDCKNVLTLKSITCTCESQFPKITCNGFVSYSFPAFGMKTILVFHQVSGT